MPLISVRKILSSVLQDQRFDLNFEKVCNYSKPFSGKKNQLNIPMLAEALKEKQNKDSKPVGEAVANYFEFKNQYPGKREF